MMTTTLKEADYAMIYKKIEATKMHIQDIYKLHLNKTFYNMGVTPSSDFIPMMAKMIASKVIEEADTSMRGDL